MRQSVDVQDIHLAHRSESAQYLSIIAHQPHMPAQYRFSFSSLLRADCTSIRGFFHASSTSHQDITPKSTQKLGSPSASAIRRHLKIHKNVQLWTIPNKK